MGSDRPRQSRLDALDACVGDGELFLAEYWGQKPGHFSSFEPYDRYISLDDLDRILADGVVRAPTVRLIKDGHALDTSLYTRELQLGPTVVSDVVDSGRAYDQFSKGASIVLHAVQHYWPPIAVLCRRLEQFLSHPVHASAYLTPSSSRALQPHYDTHDVLVLQVSGTKRWSIYPPAVQDPVASQPSPPIEATGPAIIDVELAPGESLYIPRGYVHSAYAQVDASLHITLGIAHYTGVDLIEIIKDLCVEKEIFRAALPYGFATDEARLTDSIGDILGRLSEFLNQVEPAQVAAMLSASYWSNRRPPGAHHLSAMLNLDTVDNATPMRVRDGAVAHLQSDLPGRTLTLFLGDRTLQLPAALAPAMDYVLDAEIIRGADLEAFGLSAEQCGQLVRRLVREGLLEPSR